MKKVMLVGEFPSELISKLHAALEKLMENDEVVLTDEVRKVPSCRHLVSRNRLSVMTATQHRLKWGFFTTDSTIVGKRIAHLYIPKDAINDILKVEASYCERNNIPYTGRLHPYFKLLACMLRMEVTHVIMPKVMDLPDVVTLSTIILAGAPNFGIEVIEI